MAGSGRRVVLAALCAALAARAEDLPSVAVIALQAPQLEASQQRALLSRARQRLAASHRYALLSQEFTELQLAQAPFDEDGRCLGSCVDRARDVIGAALLFSGKIQRADAKCTVQLELADVINDASTQRSEASGSCASVQKALDSALDKLLLRSGTTSAAVSAEPPPPAMTGFASAAPSQKRFRVGVQAMERGVPADALTGVRRALMEKGLQVVDGKKAQFIVRIRATVGSAPAFGGSALQPRLATVTYELTRGDSMIGTGTKTGTMAHIDPNQGSALALLAAGRAIADEVSQLLEAEGSR